MEQLTTSLKTVLGRLGPAKLAGLGVAAVSVLLCVIWLASRTTEPMGLLYAGLDPGEAGRIAQRLDELKVPYRSHTRPRVMARPLWYLSPRSAGPAWTSPRLACRGKAGPDTSYWTPSRP
jgi:hypothetical protein